MFFAKNLKKIFFTKNNLPANKYLSLNNDFFKVKKINNLMPYKYPFINRVFYMSNILNLT